jgi:hypothetical protein
LKKLQKWKPIKKILNYRAKVIKEMLKKEFSKEELETIRNYSCCSYYGCSYDNCELDFCGECLQKLTSVILNEMENNDEKN